MANTGQIVAAFRDIAATKSLSPEEVNDLIQDGITAGLAKIYGPNVEAEIEVDEESGDIEIIVLKRVVEEVEDPSSEIAVEEARWDDPGYEVGDIMEIPVDFSEFGRNAVMATKQRIVQRVREGEREKIREEFSDRIGELLSGEVQQVERGKIAVMLNRARTAEAIIPWKDQNPRERFRQGDPIRAVLKKVAETPKGPRLILSRADPDFVAALFKLEVPEVYQGIVEIKAIAREVGGRTKIAVSSRDESVDPVGACVGLRGSRVQAVVSELGGERIDIVPWHPDPEIFARRALAPAKVAKVMSDAETKVITSIVDEDQLSLAIGRNGQNVRLASQLIGWQIDLYGSREWLERGADLALFGDVSSDAMEMADFPLDELELAEETLAALQDAGYDTFLDIIDLEREDFLAVEELTEEDAEHIVALIDELTVVEEPEAPDEEEELALDETLLDEIGDVSEAEADVAEALEETTEAVSAGSEAEDGLEEEAEGVAVEEDEAVEAAEEAAPPEAAAPKTETEAPVAEEEALASAEESEVAVEEDEPEDERE